MGKVAREQLAGVVLNEHAKGALIEEAMEASRLWAVLLLAFRLVETKGMEVPGLEVWNLEGKEHTELQVGLLELLLQLKREVRFESVISFQYTLPQEACVWPVLLESMNTPMLTVAGSNAWKAPDYKWKYNKNALILHCVHVGVDGIQGGLALREPHHVVYVDATPAAESEQHEMLTRHCRGAFNASLYKILFVLPDFARTKRYFQCRLYPLDAERPYISKKLTEDATSLYDKQFLNMHGAVIWTQPDQLAPRVMMQQGGHDATDLIGYVGSLVALYAERRNATLRFRYPTTFPEVVYPLKIQNSTHHGSLDIGTTLVTAIRLGSTNETSYPYDFDKYCLMVPLPASLSIQLVPLSIVSIPVLLVIMLYMFIYGCLLLYSIIGSWSRLTFSKSLLFFDMVRAMLAQAYVMIPRPRWVTKFIYFLISLSCYVVSNMYQAFLQSFLTHPPLLPAIVSATDMTESGLKIFLPVQDLSQFREACGDLYPQILKIVTIVYNYTEFQRYRNTLNTQYMYPAYSRRWQVFSEQQKYFRRPIFFFSERLCINSDLLLSLPIRMDLPYRDLFDEFILRVHAVGLFELWSSLHFLWMVRLGILTTDDLSVVENTGEAITLEDLYWIWIGYGCLLGTAIVGFLLEVLVAVYARKGIRFSLRKSFKIWRGAYPPI